MTSPDSPSPRTEAGKRFHANEHGAACSFAAKGSCALVNDGPWGKAWIAQIEAEAAQEAPAPEGLRAAIMDALYGLAGGGEHQQGEVRVRIEEAAAAIDTVLDHAATPSPAEPPRPEAAQRGHTQLGGPTWKPTLASASPATATDRPDPSKASISARSADADDTAATSARKTDRAEARPPEGLDEAFERLLVAVNNFFIVSYRYAHGTGGGATDEKMDATTTAMLDAYQAAARLSARGAPE